MKKFRISGSQFIDNKGNALTLRGINMVCKEKSKGYIGDYQEADFELLEKLGFNTIRFGIFWAAVEPEPGKYNDTYLNEIRNFSRMAERHNLSLYLDMHQDLFSSNFEDGAPSWATLTGGQIYEKTELWSEAYLSSKAVQNAFDNFWNDTKIYDGKGIQTHYIEMWKHIADFFKDDDNIIGYDVFNEPFPGTCANNLIEKLFKKLGAFLLFHPFALNKIWGQKISMTLMTAEPILIGIWTDDEKKARLLSFFSNKRNYKKLVHSLGSVLKDSDKKLSAFYQKIRDAIRSVDSETLLFLEANYFCNTGIPSNVIPPKNDSGYQDEKLVYAPHGYDLMVDTDQYNSDCHSRLDVIFETHAEYAKKYQLPCLIGEWGCYPNATEAQKAEARYLISKFKELGFSNTYYDFSTFRGNPIQEILKY
ncbi:MAG: glycoside hydrolase family 5 protein [Treponema sp.]|nr:glycoside hydrolase family 5 protein [Treponema sp.]